jgi:hypothetical protein
MGGKREQEHHATLPRLVSKVEAYLRGLTTGKLKIDLVGNASSVFILQNIFLGVKVDRVKHISGTYN